MNDSMHDAISDAALRAGFENCTLGGDQWDHRAHVRVAFQYCSTADLPTATDRMRRGIKAFARAHATPETLERGFHETVTRAFMQLVFAANLQTGPHEDSRDFCEANPELLQKTALRPFYSHARIMTLEAKTRFVEPDLCLLPEIVGRTTLGMANDGMLPHVRRLFWEYAQSLDFEFCFDGFDREVRELPGAYDSPTGRLLLAWVESEPAGCIAIRDINGSVCEMKRLWVRPEHRRHGLGRRLATAAIGESRRLGYDAIRLETHVEMKPAHSLYRSLGFQATNPSESKITVMERTLSVDDDLL